MIFDEISTDRCLGLRSHNLTETTEYDIFLLGKIYSHMENCIQEMYVSGKTYM